MLQSVTQQKDCLKAKHSNSLIHSSCWFESLFAENFCFYIICYVTLQQTHLLEFCLFVQIIARLWAEITISQDCRDWK